MKLSPRLSQFLLHFVKKQPKGFLTLFVAGMLWPLCESLFPYFIKLTIDRLEFAHGDTAGILAAVALPVTLLIASYVMIDISLRILNITALYVFPKFRAQIRQETFNYIQHHSYQYFSNHFSGAIANKLSNLPESCHKILEVFFGSFTNILVGFFVAVYLLATANILFAVIIFAWFFCYLVILAYFLPKCDALAEIHSDAQATISGKIVDSISNIASVQLFARQKYEMAYLQTFQADEIKKSRQADWAKEKMQIAYAIISFFMIFGMFAIVIKSWSAQTITLGDVSMVGMLTLHLTALIWFFGQQVSMLLREVGNVRTALRMLSEEHEIKDQPQAKALKVTRGKIEFKDVIFSYPKGKKIFDQLNIVIHPGEKVGLVGFSGAGKTTFVNLLMRRFDIEGGHIRIDDQDIKNVSQNSLHEQISVIPQDPALFHRTLMENIRYGRLDATDEEVIAAGKSAHCEEFVKQLKQGYQTEVGERGAKLSGGQRQRVAIARAILKGAPILLLDEATSALDSITESYIQESLNILMENKTTLVVAHRLSTLADMDRILVFHKGRIIEEGTMQELLDKEGHFAKLWELQAEGFLPEDYWDEEESDEDN